MSHALKYGLVCQQDSWSVVRHYCDRIILVLGGQAYMQRRDSGTDTIDIGRPDKQGQGRWERPGVPDGWGSSEEVSP